MARRNSTNDSTATTDESVTPDTAAETPTEAKSDDDAPVDLSAFEAAFNAAADNADDSTGEVPEADVAKVNEAYRALDGLKAKNAARAFLDKAMTEAIYQQNAPRARSAVQVKEGLSAGSSSSSKTPKDPTEAFISRLAGLQAAFTLAYGDVPEGVTDGWADKVEAKANTLAEQAAQYKADLAAATDENPFDDSNVSSEVKKVVKLSSGKAASGGSGYTGGPRRNVGLHIEQVFADLEVGAFLTVTEINKARSAEYGPNDAPTTGAISQKLFPKKGEAKLPEGIEPVNEEGKARGARKVA